MKRSLVARAAICAFFAGYLAVHTNASAAPTLPTLEETRSFTHSYPNQQIGYGAMGIITDDYIGIRRSVGNGPPTLLGSLFVHSPTTGELLYQLAPPPQLSNVNYFFGSAFDIQGDLAVVSAAYEHLPKADGGTAYNAGAAYLYDLTTGQLRHKLVPEQPLGNGLFGSNVAIHGNTVALNGRGYAYLFDATTGKQIARLDGGPQAASRKFGGAVAISDSHLLVAGVVAGEQPEQNSIFVYDLATLTLQRTFRAADAKPEDHFGSRIALDGDYAAISSYYQGYNAGNRQFGSVYVFDIETGEQKAKIVPTPDVEPGKGFGYSVDILGKQLIVGAAGGNGSASLHDWTTGELLAKFTHAGVQTDIQFGSSVSLSRSHALVGTAPINVGPNTAYQYQLVPEPNCCAILLIAAVAVGQHRRRVS